MYPTKQWIETQITNPITLTCDCSHTPFTIKCLYIRHLSSEHHKLYVDKILSYHILIYDNKIKFENLKKQIKVLKDRIKNLNYKIINTDEIYSRDRTYSI